MPLTTPEPLFDEEHAAFMQGGVSITAAARDDALRTTLARARGCRVAPDRRRVVILMSPSQCAALLSNLRAHGAIAVVFSRPSTHRTLQLKGDDAVVEPVRPDDLAIALRHHEALALDLANIGFGEAFAATLERCELDDLVAVAFTPRAAFSQTPGPRAGNPLKAGE